MDILVIAASSLTCAHTHTQRDGKYIVALTDPKMDGYNTLAEARGVIWRLLPVLKRS